MKCVLLAGGKGSRLMEETLEKPKPMVEIGGKPILWHIMKSYSYYGINEFVICLGYKGDLIKKYFSEIHQNDFNCTFVNTGLETMTGGRLKKVQKYVENETFCFTYGDTVNDLNISNVINFHKKIGVSATVTACIPPEKYGILYLNGDMVENFKEKPKEEEKWVNGGYFVLEPEIFDYSSNDETVWEEKPLQNLAINGNLAAYRHKGFYQPMDTLKDKIKLNQLWNSGNAKWKVWD
jgi:glucose-1-phosphate cytidylyltransferase